MSIHLVGGGWDEEHYPRVYGAFVTEAGQRANASGRATPRIGIIQVYENDVDEGAEKVDKFTAVLSGLGPCEPVPQLVSEGGRLETGRLTDLDGLLVGGGLTPAYAHALTPLAQEIRALVADGVPYLGFSAGAAIAARRAVVGGWRAGGVPICHEDNAEDLEELTVVDGLGLVDFAVDVHAAQWGNLSRLMMAVAGGAVERGVALDESTVWIVSGVAGEPGDVRGAGQAWWVSRSEEGVNVRPLRDQTSAPPPFPGPSSAP